MVKPVRISCPFNLSSKYVKLAEIDLSSSLFFCVCVYYIVVNLIPSGARIISFTRTREVVLDAFFSAWVCTKLVGLHNQEALLLLLMLAQGRIIQTKTKNVHVKDNLIALHRIGSFFLNNNIQRKDDD